MKAFYRETGRRNEENERFTSRRLREKQSLKEFVGALKLCIPTAILTVDDLWGIDQKKTDEFIVAFSEVLNAYAEGYKEEDIIKELEDRNISVRLGDDFFTKPNGKRKYSLTEKLPCKIGDEVWAIRNYKGYERASKGVVSEMFFGPKMELVIVVHHLTRGFWGEKIFATKEEAEKAIKKRRTREK